MAQQYISAPGVQINEVDLSLRVNSPLGVGVLSMGYTSQGPTDEVLQVTSLSEFEGIYGRPTTPAERYTYHTIKALFDSPANIYFSRLPYGDNSGNIFAKDRYSALVYPVIPDDGSTTYDTLSSSGLSAESGFTYYLRKPFHIELNRQEYEMIVNEEFEWKDQFGKEDGVDFTEISAIGNAGLIVLNRAQSTINEIYEGSYIAISDNRDTDPASPYKDVTRINSINNDGDFGESYITVPDVRMDFTLSSDSDVEDSLSQVIENIPSFETGTKEFDDLLSIGLIKLRRTPFTNSEVALSYALTESYVGSFDPDRQLQNPTGGENQSIFLETIDNDSNNLEFFVNENLKDVFSMNLTSSGLEPLSKLRVLDSDITSNTQLSSVSTDEYANEAFPIGAYQESRGSDKTIGATPAKVSRVLDLVENPDLFELDLVVEGGLGTVYTSVAELSSGTYDDRTSWDSLSGLREQTSGSLNSTTFDNYASIYTTFENFCSKRRKDCMFIADPIRHIFITGNNSRVLDQTYIDESDNRVAKSFSQYIYWPLRNQFRAANSSYAAAYANWVKVFDNASNKQAWVPYSGFAASMMARMDNVWDAPAGFTRGLNTNIIDIALYPKKKEQGQLYKISLNPIMFSPSDGFVTNGQKTLLAKPSSFDRINVRRVFLFLEKATLNTAKYFVFEPNTLFTRNQVVNTLSPLFENVKNKDGIRDYMLVCNEDNNTDEIIEQNQLKVDVYIKPTKSSEFILIDFISTRQDADFQEIIR